MIGYAYILFFVGVCLLILVNAALKDEKNASEGIIVFLAITAALGSTTILWSILTLIKVTLFKT